jgi:hypothetical protein
MPKEGGAVRAPARIRQRSENIGSHRTAWWAREDSNLQPDRYGAEWAVVEPMVPPAKPGGRERTIDVREILNGAVDRLPMAGAAQRPAAEEHSMGLFPSMLTDLLRRGLRLVNVFATCGGGTVRQTKDSLAACRQNTSGAAK